MTLKNVLNIKILKKTGLFDIRAFVFVFMLYSLISIWSANSIATQDKKLDILFNEIKLLKSKYVSTKTILMDKTRQSNLLKRGEDFYFFQSNQPIKTISLEYED